MKGNLKVWQYEALMKLSNKYKMDQADHDEMHTLAERAYDDGFDTGYSWGEDALRDRVSDLENELVGHRSLTASVIAQSIEVANKLDKLAASIDPYSHPEERT